MTTSFKDWVLGLPTATTPASGDYVPVVQSGAVKKADAAGLGSGGGGGGSTSFAGLSDVAITSAADWDVPRYDSATGRFINDQTSNNPAIVANTSGLATLQSQFAALSTSSVVSKRGTNSLISAATTVSSDLYGADATTVFVGDDGLVYFGKWEFINTSGGNIALSILTKLAGTNSLNPANINLASTGASTSYFIDVAHILTAGADATHHSQYLVIQVRPAIAKNSNSVFAFGYATDAVTPANTLDMHGIVQSTALDIGVTRPSFELRINMTTATANTSLQRIVGEMYLVKDH